MGLLVALGLLVLLGLVWFVVANSRAKQQVWPGLTKLDDRLAVLATQEPDLTKALSPTLEALTQQGWGQAACLAYLDWVAVWSEDLAGLFAQAQAFGSPVHQSLLQADRQAQSSPRQVLAASLACLSLPDSLTGSPRQTKALLDRFWPELPAHAPFWRDLASLVDQAFPGQALSEPADAFACQVHQLRYLLSDYQLNWLRRTYGGAGLSDRQALVTYLAKADRRDNLFEWLGLAPYDYQLTYDLRESARLHNKRGHDRLKPGALPIFPNGQEGVNLKILINWHSEFILSDQGRLLSVLEVEEGLGGLINGASFNYSSRSGRRHRELDMAPVRSHDPAHRRRQLKGRRIVYGSPNRCLKPWSENWTKSYYNPKGLYAVGTRSSHGAVRQASRHLSGAIKQARYENMVN